MNTLFFLISIIGLIVITVWAYRNDRRANIAEQDGILAIKLPRLSKDQGQSQGPSPKQAAKSFSPSSKPPRRRFITP